MHEINPENTAAYLRETGRAPADAPIIVEALGWGVSNIVLRVVVAGHEPIVLKQSREQLRTRMHWVSRLDRIWTETAALRYLATGLPAGAVPLVLWEDRENYLFAMSCALDDAVVWKESLLAGRADSEVAQRAGEILGAMHARPMSDDWGLLADTTVFDQLRLDPFYRTAARSHPDLAPRFHALIDEALAPPERTFVHADFSPKNLLVHSRGLGLTVVDFETSHAGDPAFDLGFFTSHLLLKALRAAPGHGPYLDLMARFWESYLPSTRLDLQADRVRRASLHAAACALARIDGKSPVDYLDEPRREAVRRLARRALGSGSIDWSDLIELAAQEMRAIPAGQEC